MADGSTGIDGETRLQPSNIEAEQALLGALLVNNDAFDRITGIVNEGHFYDPVHARIFEVIAARISKNALASPVTLKAFLADDPGLKELGGPAYLAQLAGAAISVFAVRDYAQLIYDLAIRRNLIEIGNGISLKAADVAVESEPREQIIEAEQQLYQLGEQGSVETGFQSFLRAVTDAIEVANAAYQRRPRPAVRPGRICARPRHRVPLRRPRPLTMRNTMQRTSIFTALSMLALGLLSACNKDRPASEVPAASDVAIEDGSDELDPADEDAGMEDEDAGVEEPASESEDAEAATETAPAAELASASSAQASEPAPAADPEPAEAEKKHVATASAKPKPKKKPKAKKRPKKKRASKGEAACGEGTCA